VPLRLTLALPPYLKEMKDCRNAWVNTNFLIWLGLKEQNELDLANKLATKTLDLVKKSGIREFYNPYTGDRIRAKSFGWSTLVAIMKKALS